MQIENVTIQITEFELKTLRYFLRMGVKYQVQEIFVQEIFEHENKEDFKNWIENKNNELEFMSSICNIYNTSNLIEYAERIYKDLTDK